ncbi:MAG TPA: hypothetical protein VK395_12570 [Gemmataceae bacterium]|nr:hypothetical protein [Gemmataceae bacterium]
MATGTLALALLLLTPGQAPADDVVPMNSRNFKIPIQTAVAERAKIKELILFSSTDKGKTWQQAAVSAPDKDAFVFYAPTDGLYWFNLVVVDEKGQRKPADLYNTVPRQKILVDTLKPNLRIVSAERHGEELQVKWEIQEDHPDLSTLKLEYRTPDAPTWMWYRAPAAATMSGQAQFRFASSGPVVVRMQVMDQAGNIGSDQKEIPANPAAPSPPPERVVAVNAPSNQSGNLGVNPSPILQAPPPSPSPAPVPPAPTLPSTSVAYSPPPMPQAPLLPSGATNTERMPPAQMASNFNEVRAPAEQAWVPASNSTYQQAYNPVADFNNRYTTPISYVPAPTSMSTQPWGGGGPLPPLQITNSTQVTLHYRVDKVGPSGVGSVELYLTQDDGQTWQRFAEDPHLTPPMTMTVNLPGEGVYGLRLVVGSRAGLGRRPPRSGEPPQMRVEVDTTAPLTKLLYPQADPHRRDVLIIGWSASDRNLAANPVTLEWAEGPDGPWQTIANELTNSGRYTWQLPQSLPYRVYLRAKVRDTAGNVGIDETPAAILVDLHEPEGQITGIEANARHP